MNLEKTENKNKLTITLKCYIILLIYFIVKGTIVIIKTNSINIRDPFVLVNKNTYYMYGTRGATLPGSALGFDVYVSNDLENWSEPIEVFCKTDDFWSDMNYWAPEVHFYKGAFYMFATFKAKGRFRGTQILKSISPTGPFEIHSNGPVTPPNWECLDGTLYVDQTGIPYMVFCHEWTQVKNGEVCSIMLSNDLSCAIGEPRILFQATEANWIRPIQGNDNFVTDGCFLYRCEGGALLMLWSSFGKEGYTEAIAKSDNGEITGNWIQQDDLLFEKDGGHGMLLKSLQGKLLLVLHSPNESPAERPVFFEILDKDNMLYLMSTQ